MSCVDGSDSARGSLVSFDRVGYSHDGMDTPASGHCLMIEGSNGAPTEEADHDQATGYRVGLGQERISSSWHGGVRLNRLEAVGDDP